MKVTMIIALLMKKSQRIVAFFGPEAQVINLKR